MEDSELIRAPKIVHVTLVVILRLHSVQFQLQKQSLSEQVIGAKQVNQRSQKHHMY